MAKSILKVGGFTIKKPRVFEQTETEYKVAQRINHPYVRKCYKLKKIRSVFNVKEMLLSMELFDGKSLEDGPALSLVDVLLVFRMVATGLNAMHREGYVHCDIKPNNILISKAGSIKIIDLGQSCKIGTTKRRIQGTPAYIAPEQVRRKPLGPRTDVFNLGATMYWALTGKNVPTLIHKRNGALIPKRNDTPGTSIQRNYPAPHELKQRIPIGVSTLVMDCVKDNPAQRPSNMMTVISRLDLIIHSLIGSKIKTNKHA